MLNYLTQLAAIVDQETTKTIIAYMILVLPLFSLPFILKFVGGISERVGLWANNKQRGLVDRPKAWAQKRGQETRKARMANARARMTEFGQHRGFNKDEKTGATTKRGGFRAAAARGIGAAGSYNDRRQRTLGWQEEEAHRAQNEALFGQLAETDEFGNPTARAQKLALQAAGVGGEKGAERIRFLATQQKLEEAGKERRQASQTLETSGMYGKGTYFSIGEDGKLEQHNNTGRALAELARGQKVGVVAAGKQVQRDAAGNVTNAKFFDGGGTEGSTATIAAAAMERIAKTGDGAAYGYVMHGMDEGVPDLDENGAVKLNANGETIYKKDANGVTITRKKVKALQSERYDDFMQFAGDNASSAMSKIPHLFKADDAYTGVTSEQIAEWHGTEFKAAASRVAQLRLQGDSKSADRMEGAIIKAWNGFQSDDRLAGKRNQKKSDGFAESLLVMRGDAPRVALREYGDQVDSNGTIVATVDKSGTGRITGDVSKAPKAPMPTIDVQYSGSFKPSVREASGIQTVEAGQVSVAAPAGAPTQTITVPVQATANQGRYTVGFTSNDIGPQTIDMQVQSAGGTSRIADRDAIPDADIEKWYAASANVPDTAVNDNIRVIREQYTARNLAPPQTVRERVTQTQSAPAEQRPAETFVASTTGVIGNQTQVSEQRRDQRAAEAAAAANRGPEPGTLPRPMSATGRGEQAQVRPEDMTPEQRQDYDDGMNR